MARGFSLVGLMLMLSVALAAAPCVGELTAMTGATDFKLAEAEHAYALCLDENKMANANTYYSKAAADYEKIASELKYSYMIIASSYEKAGDLYTKVKMAQKANEMYGKAIENYRLVREEDASCEISRVEKKARGELESEPQVQKPATTATKGGTSDLMVAIIGVIVLLLISVFVLFKYD